MAHKKIKRFQEGGMSEDEDKAAGLEASRDDKVGFLERLRMGNIDDSSSEAYKRFGAGRGRAARVPVEDRAGTPVEEIRARETPAPQTISDAMMDRGRAEGMRTGSGDASVAESTGPRTKPFGASARPATTSPVAVRSSSSAAPIPKMISREEAARRSEAFGPRRVNKSAPASNTASTATPSATSSTKSAADMIPTGSNNKVTGGERIEPMSDTERNVTNILAGTGAGAGALGMLYKGKKMLDARKAAQVGAKKRANLKRDVEEGIDRNLASEFQDLASSAAKNSTNAKTAAERTRDLTAGQAKTKFTSQSKAPSKRTKKLDDSEVGVEFKRGGKAMKSGGSVSPASKRADGIATRGKTRCKIC